MMSVVGKYLTELCLNFNYMNQEPVVMVANIVDVVLQPIGRTPGVLEPPLAKYKPQIVVLLTSHQEYADVTAQHIEHTWRRHIGRLPHVIVKIVETPWTSDAVDRYMTAFDEAVEEVRGLEITQNATIQWHVGTAGGTNLMAIGSALSAFTHRFPVYGSLDQAHNPTLQTEELAIDIDLFMNLGPGFKALTKPRSMRIMRYVCEQGPVGTHDIIKHIEGSKQNESAGRKPLVDANLIQKNQEGKWVATNVGRSLMATMALNKNDAG
jgi:DNA-binding transcriptional ArsR family regulator